MVFPHESSGCERASLGALLTHSQVQQKYLTLQKSSEPDKRLQTLITGSNSDVARRQPPEKYLWRQRFGRESINAFGEDILDASTLKQNH